MMKKSVYRLLFLGLVVALFSSSLMIPQTAEAAPPQTLYPGSQNGDVWDLQYRLSTSGYYNGKIDGIMGWETTQAVRKFQRDHGLVVDGIVGINTWSALKKYTLSKNEVYLVARAVYGEARGESYEGQVAVAAVILNRMESPKFPDTARGVIFQNGAFTAVNDGQIWYTPNEQAVKAVIDALHGWDPSRGALYYFNPNTATSKWIWSRPQIVQIGNHIFTA